MNALVTGGAGFIGIHLVDRLLLGGHTVTVLDRFSGRKKEHCRKRWGRRVRLVEVNIAYLFRHSGEPQRVQNLQKVTSRSDSGQARMTDKTWQNCFKGIDYVFHLAANSRKGLSIKQPQEFHRANVDGTINILEAARHAGVSKFIFAGTASCYGIPHINPVPETAEMKLNDIYAFTKYLGEQYTLHWGNVYKLPVLILRLFNVYGPRTPASAPFGSTLSLFLSQKMEHKPYTIVGDGTQKRDFTHVSDVVEGFIQAAQSDITNEVINVATGKGRSINDLLDLLGGKKTYLPKSKTEADCLYADIRKAKKLLNWEPKVNLEEGIKRVLQSI